jgi:riboflavin kinase/FMN adenylyltransferase
MTVKANQSSVLTLGTFDGVHRGHLALIRKVVQRAKAIGAQSVALSFDMPPRHAGDARSKPVLLTTLDEKLALLKKSGIDQVQVLIFDRKTASTTPEDFFQKTILKKHHTVEMVVGPRVAFGRRRAGKLPLLRRLGQEHGVRIHVVPSIARGGGAVSSRRIRALMASGDIEGANKLLGYPYSISGRVVHGDRRGRHLGFPTANIQVDPDKIIPRGVYFVKVFPGSGTPLIPANLKKGLDGVCNVGIRPTFTPNAHVLHCEVFLLHRRGSLYGRKLRVCFLRRIRPEKRFASVEALKRQIAKDVTTAQSMGRLYKNGHFSI